MINTWNKELILILKMQRIPLGSPTKENQQSPVKKGKGSTLSELIAFVKNSGVNVPPSIAKIISSASNP